MTDPKYHGEDFCPLHGYDHMRCAHAWGAIPYCQVCEDERAAETERAVDGILAASDDEILTAAARDKADPPRCGNCEYFDNGTAGPDGHSDCLNSHAPTFQTYAHQHCALWQRSS